MVLISAHILDPVQMLHSFRLWDKVMYINPEDELAYATHYKEAFLKYVEIEYCAKHRRLLFNKLETVPSSNLVLSTPASVSDQPSIDT
jgi:hypothetical protein